MVNKKSIIISGCIAALLGLGLNTTIQPKKDLESIVKQTQNKEYKERAKSFIETYKSIINKIIDESNNNYNKIKDHMTKQYNNQKIPYQEHIEKASARYRIDPCFLAATIYNESKFNSDVVSKAGAAGLCQLMPKTAKSQGLRIELKNKRPTENDERLDPEKNIYACSKLIKYLKDSKRTYERTSLAFLLGQSKDIKKLPDTKRKQAEAYARRVTGLQSRYHKENYFKE
jgi:soluble lytic murein transglycosylase-like protein